MFESVDGHTHRRTHRRRLDGYTISSPCEPKANVSFTYCLLIWFYKISLNLNFCHGFLLG